MLNAVWRYSSFQIIFQVLQTRRGIPRTPRGANICAQISLDMLLVFHSPASVITCFSSFRLSVHLNPDGVCEHITCGSGCLISTRGGRRLAYCGWRFGRDLARRPIRERAGPRPQRGGRPVKRKIDQISDWTFATNVIPARECPPWREMPRLT